MKIDEHIEYWLKSSDDDYEVFKVLLNSNNYLHAMFIAHLSLEKLLKAHWIKTQNKSIPSKLHNLVSLLKQTNLELEPEQLTFLTQMNDFQIQGRYPYYKFKIKQLLN